MPRDTDTERRTFGRVRLKLPIRFRMEERPEEWVDGVTRYLSATGMLLMTETCIEIAARLMVVLTIPGDQATRQLRGVVVRTQLGETNHQYLIGVKFVDLEEADRAHLASLLHDSDIMELLRLAAAEEASDLHLSSNHPPIVRVMGQLKPLREQRLPGVKLKHMIYTLLDERQRQVFERDLELNASVSIEPTLRYRLNVHMQRGNVEAAFRRIEPVVKTIAELNLPKTVIQFAHFQDGLVLVTGPAGAGKTTTVNAMVDYINTTKSAVVITLENPIEYVHVYKRSVIKQREVGTDTLSFPVGLREAMRQDPDVIVIGEVRDEITMKTALDAAETGHLVLATFPASDCLNSILRVFHFFSKERQQEIQLQLSNCLRAVLSQRLIARADRPGVIPATEVLLNTAAVANTIRTGSIEQIPTMIQTGTEYGMHSLEHSLKQLVQRQIIQPDAYKQHSQAVREVMKAP